MNIITGYRGEPHITSAQDRAQNQGSYGTGSYILDVGQQLAAEIVSANEVRIRDGVLSHQGCVGIIEQGAYDSLEIANGSQGMQRIDLIVARYTKNSETNVESLELVVIEGTAAASNPTVPSYNTGDIQAGDSPVDMPLYRVNINGVNISSTTLAATKVQTQAELQTAVSELNSKTSDYWEFKYKGDIGSSVNVDDLKSQALYRTLGATNQPQNLPAVISYGMLYVIVAGALVHQVIMRPTSGLLFVREWSGNPGSWSSWYKATMSIVN